MAVAGLHNISILESPFLNRSSKRVPQHRVDGLRSDESRVDVSDGHESEHSCISDELSVRENDFGSESGHDDSSDMGDIERERVRQIFREWTSCAARERASSVSSRSNGPRAEWLGENEQERVRVIREWVQMNSRQRSTRFQHREDQGTQSVGHIEDVLRHRRRGFRRICGRQALIDMLNKAERERQQELQGLLERRAVSQFSHRNRIQSLLRGRFLRNDRVVDNKRPTSTAASELGYLRQRHTVSGLREGFLSRLDSSSSRAGSSISDASSTSDINGHENSQIQLNNMQIAADECHEQTESRNGARGIHGLSDEITDLGSDIAEDDPCSGREFRRREQSANIELIQRRDSAEHVNVNGSRSTHENETGEPTLSSISEMNSQQAEPNEGSFSSSFLSNRVDELDGRAVENVDQQQSENTRPVHLGTNDWRDSSQSNADGNQQEAVADEWMESEEIELWHEDHGFQEPVQSWLEVPSEQNAVPPPRVDPFYLPDGDNVRNVELRELMSRRSVSTLLGSGFRESLDQLVWSYVERQSHGPLDWELQESAEHELEPQSGGQTENSDEQSQHRLSSLPVLPMQQLWDHDTQHFPWPQQRYRMEWDAINDMRVDMARLQQRMNNMQRMLEACMDMQLELQRSIRQEVSAALNRSGSSNAMGENNLAEDRHKWDSVRKGICCMCSESGIDSLLYRCGHMCTCSKCATGLVQKGEKCPMCKAPVIEVIRAYSVL